MKNFKYCIWLLPEENSLCNQYTQDFTPHITIKSKLEYEDAIKLYHKITSQTYNLPIKIDTLSYITRSSDFYSIQFEAKLATDNVPEWWPDRAHVSAKYKYDTPFTDDDLNNMNKQFNPYTFMCNRIKLYECNGHYTTWKLVNI